MAGGILVVSEHLRLELADITFEMLGAGKKVADALGAPLYSVTIGENIAPLALSLGIADTVCVIDRPHLSMPSPDTIASLLKGFIEQKGISLTMIGGTNLSMGIGPLLSMKCQLPFINFCTALRVEEGTIVFTSQLFGGKILTDICLSDNRGIVSLYPGAFPPEGGRSERTAAHESVDIPVEESKIAFKRFIEPEAGDVDIARQDVLIAIGRGIQNQDNVKLAEELAEILGGVVCGSRPVIDQGWLPLSRQVGKSGKIVKPRLYLALGVSGAPEHIEGMQNSELIIPINTDPGAPIFGLAHFGVNEDIFDIVPPLIEAVKARKGDR